MSLLSVPNELIVIFGQYMESEKDICALMQVDRRCFNLLNGMLYRYNIQNHDGSEILWGARHGYILVIQRFIAEGFVVRFESTYNKAERVASRISWDSKSKEPKPVPRHPLLYAVAYGHVHIVRFLVEEEKSDPDYLGDSGSSPMHLAAKSGHLAAIKVLIANGAGSMLLEN